MAEVQSVINLYNRRKDELDEYIVEIKLVSTDEGLKRVLLILTTFEELYFLEKMSPTSWFTKYQLLAIMSEVPRNYLISLIVNMFCYVCALLGIRFRL